MSPAASILSQIGEAKGRISRTQQLLALTSAVGLAALAIGFVGIQTPWENRRRQLEVQYNEEKERSGLLLGIHKQRADLQKMENQLLLQGGATMLEGRLSELAAQSGLQIESVTPQPEIVTEPYTQFRIEIIASGNLNNILKFLQSIETHRPLFWVAQMDIGGSSSEKLQDPQRVRFLIGAVTRQKASG